MVRQRGARKKQTNILFCGNLNALSESAIKEINVDLERSASSSFHHKEPALEKNCQQKWASVTESEANVGCVEKWVAQRSLFLQYSSPKAPVIIIYYN